MPSSFQAQRLNKHADYGLVYSASRKHSSTSLSFFYRASTPHEAVRFGITVPRAIGNAVLRNRIKRRLRIAARLALAQLPSGIDVVLHPRPAVATMPWDALCWEMQDVFGRVTRRVAAGADNTPLPRTPRSKGKKPGKKQPAKPERPA